MHAEGGQGRGARDAGTPAWGGDPSLGREPQPGEHTVQYRAHRHITPGTAHHHCSFLWLCRLHQSMPIFLNAVVLPVHTSKAGPRGPLPAFNMC